MLLRLTRVALLLLAAAASAEPSLSLTAVMERAAAEAPDVKLAAFALQEAEASQVGTGVFLPTNPRLFVDYRRLASPPPMDPINGYNLGLDGTLEVSGAGFARLDEAQRRVALARSELDSARTLARVRAWTGFIELQVARRRVVRVEEALATATRVENASRERQKNGVVGEPDVLAAALETANVRQELDEARRLEEVAQAGLRAVLDLGPDVTLQLEGQLSEPGDVDDEATLVQRAVERRPELEVVRARLALLEATGARLSREAFPKLTYNLGFDAAPASPVFGFAGLGVELPVAQRNQGPRAIARAQLETERLRLETELRRVQRDVATARRSYLLRRSQVELLSKQAVPAAERYEDLVEEGWKAGRFDLFRLTAATRDLNRVRRERLETLLAAWTDYVELQRASGGLNP